jgi:NAD(P)-dependent dehydrogenase (short-subunit alcohol dehydrogenase family)
MSAPSRFALVTGSSGGIGSGIVRALSNEGISVLGADLAEPPPDTQMALCQHATLDLQHWDESRLRLVELIGGRPLVALIAAAGARVREENELPHGLPSVATFRQTVDDNLTIHYAALEAAFAALCEGARVTGDASVMLIGSISAYAAYGGVGYSAAKAGLDGLVRVQAKFLGQHKVRINAVHPGTVRTGRRPDLSRLSAADLRRLESSIALGRIPTGAEMGGAIAKLAMIPLMTGQSVVIDAGQLVMRS